MKKVLNATLIVKVREQKINVPWGGGGCERLGLFRKDDLHNVANYPRICTSFNLHCLEWYINGIHLLCSCVLLKYV